MQVTIVGLPGSGTTTVFNLLTRFIPVTRGEIRLRGEDITGARPADIARRGMVRSFQVSAVFPALTAVENVRVALQRKQGGTFAFWLPVSSVDVLNARAMENPAELLSAARTADIIDEIEAQLRPDVVLFDLSPVLVSDDANGFSISTDFPASIA